MADWMYTLAKKKLLDGDIDLLVSDIKVAMIDTAVATPVQATDEFLSPEFDGAIIASSANLANKTTTGGAFDADPAEFSAVTGDSVEAVVIYVDSGDPDTSPVIAKLDTGVTGLPYTPSGADVILTWGAYIFALTD
jgi:glutamine synthetase type III